LPTNGRSVLRRPVEFAVVSGHSIRTQCNAI